jgi:uncharacterized repeat protein (TIGR04076 family)
MQNMKQMDTTNLAIEQRPLSTSKKCPWHRKYKAGKTFLFDEIFPHRICPWLYNSVYPYFLGLYYGARFSWNEDGDCNVCCPAAKGVDVIVRLRPNDGSFDSRISPSMKFVIYAEVVAVLGDCPFGHVMGQRILFPTCMVEHFMCPAAFHNVFPLMQLDPPSCIDLGNLRCPDWNDVIFFKLP